MPIIDMEPKDMLLALVCHHLVWKRLEKRDYLQLALPHEAARLGLSYPDGYWYYCKGGDLVSNYELVISDVYRTVDEERAARILLDEKGATSTVLALKEERRERWDAAPMSHGHVHYRLYGFKEIQPSRTLRRTK